MCYLRLVYIHLLPKSLLYTSRYTYVSIVRAFSRIHACTRYHTDIHTLQCFSLYIYMLHVPLIPGGIPGGPRIPGGGIPGGGPPRPIIGGIPGGGMPGGGRLKGACPGATCR